jgi:hypothetical protein
MSEADKGRPSYLDLLVATLMEHEKDLDRLVEKLEKASTKISAARKTAGSKTKDKPIEKEEETQQKPASDSRSLVYMKIGLDRPIDEVIKIIESLKE